ncbi:hypothetical protein [Flavobacterium sp. Sr18]|uniref:hypothetical protein n=1 Tax=Flavobacterium sp. Sr18 TaxID=935222 RepID=UPI001F49981E|nr:hypothetical protein [Flavobacterium sp. Sr18]
MGLSATQEDLDHFKLLASSQSLIQKADLEGRNIDVFIKENFIVDTSKVTHSYEGSFTASFIRDLLMKQSKSFSFETVMSHKSKINEIKAIVASGYHAYLYFVCIDSPEVNISRVSNRVDKGGILSLKTKLRTGIIGHLNICIKHCLYVTERIYLIIQVRVRSW